MRSGRPRETGVVADVMRRQFVTASPEETLPGVRQTMRLARLRHLLVTRDERLLGLISYRDLLESLLDRPTDPVPSEDEDAPLGAQDLLSSAMTPSPAFVTPGTPIAEAADRLCRYGFGCLPVVESTGPEARIVGLITEADLLRAAFGLPGR